MRKLTFTLILIFIIITKMSAQTEIDLWPGTPPNSIQNDTINEKTTTDKNGIVRVQFVKKPTLKIYLPDKAKNSGAAVIICPGGGYSILAIDHEGYKVAEFLNSIGVAAVVLKYRLPEDFLVSNKEIVPLLDAQQAIRTIRKNASKYNIEPNKIGIMGFSAGGHLAATATTHFNTVVGDIKDETSVRPDFSILVYPVVSFMEHGHAGTRNRLVGKNATPDLIARYSNELWVNEETPPTLLIHSSDDKAVPVENSIRFYQQCVKYGVPATMHIFETGGHGYGIGRGKGNEKNWPHVMSEWMKGRGLISE